MLKLFFADDEYFVRQALKNNVAWEKNGMTVVGDANNGKTAYQMILDRQPDIAIIDVNMPVYNGIELISRLVKQNVSCKYIILSGYNEFKYAQQAIQLGVKNYILKPVDYRLLMKSIIEVRKEINVNSLISSKMSKLEEENKELVSDRYFNDLVNCNPAAYSLHKYDKDLEQNFCLNYQLYAVFIVDFAEKFKKEDMAELKNAITNQIKAIPFICCIDVKNRLFFITEAISEEKYLACIYSTYDYIRQKGFSICIGIGNSYNDFKEIYLSYNEACMALKNSGIYAKEVISYKDILPNQQKISLDGKYKNIVKTRLRNGTAVEVQESLHAIYQDLRANRTLIDVVILQTLDLLNLLMENMNKDQNHPISILDSKGSILDELEDKRSIDEIENWITHLYCMAIRNLADKNNQCCSITSKIEEYIKNNISNPELSIEQIAKNLYLNYSYICYCYKRDNSITINDHISQLRIQNAMELFKNHCDNITLVSEKTGFNNVSYFSKRFKKATGLSPSKYLKIID